MKFIKFSLFLGILLVGAIRTTALYLESPIGLPPTPLASETSTSTPTTESTPTESPTPEMALDTSLPYTITATPEPSPTAYVVEYKFGPADFPENINPLTGLPVNDPDILNRRPIAIKICNYPRNVRPQWGLNLADHVFEYHIGDYMTRFVGIFYGKNAERVGPVRSARFFDEEVMRMYKSYFVFGYADPKVRAHLYAEDLKPLLVIETPSNCPPICRYDNGLAYNNLFADTAYLTPWLEGRRGNNQRQNLNGLHFDLDAPKSGHPGERFTIHFTTISYHRWEWDPENSHYLRFQEAYHDLDRPQTFAPLFDAMTDSQVYADNVVVLRVYHRVVFKSSSTEIHDIPLSGHGNGYAFRDGQLFPIVWSVEAPNRLFNLRFPNGELYPLKPGNVYFEIIGATSKFEPREDGSWYFDFHMP